MFLVKQHRRITQCRIYSLGIWNLAWALSRGSITNRNANAPFDPDFIFAL
jgi:hypothetical protein